ncbi:hypothetical protein Lesp01_56300 [Lentzea sp. NBRC 102530]|nr:hypothetical protein Lesp01_56300 [Lentzea sp. NBRC 102530]
MHHDTHFVTRVTGGGESRPDVQGRPVTGTGLPSEMPRSFQDELMTWRLVPVLRVRRATVAAGSLARASHRTNLQDRD